MKCLQKGLLLPTAKRMMFPALETVKMKGQW